jgi:PAS domain S-box-containing protein
MFRIYGLEPGEITPTTEFVFSHVHRDDRDRVERAVERLDRLGRLPPLDYRFIRPDGSVRHLRATMAVVVREPDGEARVIAGSLQDLTERHRAERPGSATSSASSSPAAAASCCRRPSRLASLEVLQLAARGLSGRRIAGQLVVSAATVKTHFKNISIASSARDCASRSPADRVATLVQGPGEVGTVGYPTV